MGVEKITELNTSECLAAGGNPMDHDRVLLSAEHVFFHKLAKMIGIIVIVALCAAQACAEDAPKRLRVGVFKRADVLVAFYKSAAWDQHLKDLTKQREEAKAQGDEKRVKEIEEQGAKSQEYAHQQLAGRAPLDNIFEHITDKLPGVSRQAGVSVIVEKPLYNRADVELVDVTELLVKLLPPKTRK